MVVVVVITTTTTVVASSGGGGGSSAIIIIIPIISHNTRRRFFSRVGDSPPPPPPPPGTPGGGGRQAEGLPSHALLSFFSILHVVFCFLFREREKKRNTTTTTMSIVENRHHHHHHHHRHHYWANEAQITELDKAVGGNAIAFPCADFRTRLLSLSKLNDASSFYTVLRKVMSRFLQFEKKTRPPPRRRYSPRLGGSGEKLPSCRGRILSGVSGQSFKATRGRRRFRAGERLRYENVQRFVEGYARRRQYRFQHRVRWLSKNF